MSEIRVESVRGDGDGYVGKESNTQPQESLATTTTTSSTPASSSSSAPTNNTDTTTQPKPEPETESIQEPILNCSHCKTPSTPTKPLKECPKCHSGKSAYCSRECLKSGWKVHKKVCAKEAQVWSQNADIKMASRAVPKNDGRRGGLQKWQFDTST